MLKMSENEKCVEGKPKLKGILVTLTSIYQARARGSNVKDEVGEIL